MTAPAVTVHPQEFKFVTFDATLIERIAAQLAEALGIDRPMVIEVDEQRLAAPQLLADDEPERAPLAGPVAGDVLVVGADAVADLPLGDLVHLVEDELQRADLGAAPVDGAEHLEVALERARRTAVAAGEVAVVVRRHAGTVAAGAPGRCRVRRGCCGPARYAAVDADLTMRSVRLSSTATVTPSWFLISSRSVTTPRVSSFEIGRAHV